MLATLFLQESQNKDLSSIILKFRIFEYDFI